MEYNSGSRRSGGMVAIALCPLPTSRQYESRSSAPGAGTPCRQWRAAWCFDPRRGIRQLVPALNMASVTPLAAKLITTFAAQAIIWAEVDATYMQAQPYARSNNLGINCSPRRGHERHPPRLQAHHPFSAGAFYRDSEPPRRRERSSSLAVKAIADCLALSRNTAEDMDLLVCCNICRSKSVDAVSVEPSMAASLRAHFAFTSSTLTFDC